MLARDRRRDRLARVLCVLLLAGGATAGADEPAPPPAAVPDAVAAEPTGEELAERWFDQLLGFDALEAYEVRRGEFRLEFVVARKWGADGQRLLIDIVSPPGLEELAFLFRPHGGQSLDAWVYLPGLRRVRRIPPLEVEFPLPGVGVDFPIGALRAFQPGELHYERLPDREFAGEPCRVVEGRPVGSGPRFDRMRLLLSRVTGVALETTFERQGRPLQRIEVRPGDARPFEGRWLPERRRISYGSGVEAELVLRNLMLDPALPDRLFSEHNLRAQRFPSF